MQLGAVRLAIAKHCVTKSALLVGRIVFALCAMIAWLSVSGQTISPIISTETSSQSPRPRFKEKMRALAIQQPAKEGLSRTTGKTKIVTTGSGSKRRTVRKVMRRQTPIGRYPKPRPRPTPAIVEATSSSRASSRGARPSRETLSTLQNNLSKLCNGASKVPVEILHLGDSHSAADILTGYIRDNFQRDFGSGGRGMLPVGLPFKYYGPKQVKVTARKKWKHQSSFKKKHTGPFGITGFRASANSSKQRLVLATRKSPSFEMFKVEVRALDGGGDLNVKIGGWPTTRLSTRVGSHRTAGLAGMLHWIDPLRARSGRRLPYTEHTFYVGSGAKKVEIWPAGNGPVELLSWSLRRGQPGVLYHSQGVIGSTAELIHRWDRELVHAQLDRMRPDLIVMAYGTNEGFNDALNIKRYKRNVRRALSELRTASPSASIAIVAPPDAARLPRYCSKALRKRASCKSLSGSEQRNYRSLLRAKSPALCRWHAPPKLSKVRTALKRIADSNGYFYWDWSGVMGGQCGTDKWTKRSPRLAHGDRVHLTNKGYKHSADAFYAELRGRVSCPAKPRRS